MDKSFDYVIVGGGSAGCVLAARLSETPNVRVCLIEAGSGDRHPMIHMPVGFAKMTTGPLTWGLTTAPQRHANNREIPYAQARVLGGGPRSTPRYSPAGFLPTMIVGLQKVPRGGVLTSCALISCGQKAMLCCRANGMELRGL